jgi:23S rRNA (guanosine2251-2'-O)-methyltransferase
MTIKKTMPELERIAAENYAQKHTQGLVIVLDNVRSAFNVGSIFRTGDGFGVTKIYLCGITCQTDNRELQKTALGAEMSIPSEYAANTIDVISDLKTQGYQILSLEQTKNSISLSDFQFELKNKYALVVGNEVEGVSDEVIQTSDIVIEIPQVGSKHSLNVSNATSIVLWELFKSISLNQF